ncbi:MAG TPA: type 4a pilus biogenesis protein PilO [Patescibacteria group bacterium]|nr:type 4a pilus biogenesis protein PilO [Patescibacteria group bacterium]
MATNWREQYQRYKEFYLNIQSLYKQRADLRAFLEIILSVSTVIVFLVFALKPTALTIISLYGQIQEKKKTSADLSQKLTDLETANANFTKNSTVIPDIDASIGSFPQPSVIVQQIQGAAAKDSVTILGISVGEVTLVGNVSNKKTSSDLKPLPGGALEMPISISSKGNYLSLSTFIADLENLRTIINIDSVGINSSETEKGKTTVSIISGRVPYLGQ